MAVMADPPVPADILVYIDSRLAQQKREQDVILAEQMREQDAKIAALEEKIEEQRIALEETKAVVDNLVDPRIQIWTAGASSAPSSISSEVRLMRKTYKEENTCMFCGCNSGTKELSIAHIVPSKSSAINVVFGRDNNYVDDVKLESTQNFLVLCGSHGRQGTCHNAYDNLKISLYFNISEGVYRWYIAKDANVHGFGRVLTVEELGEKYVRLLAWRTLSTVLQPGPTFPGTPAERTAFINMLKISEEEECND